MDFDMRKGILLVACVIGGGLLAPSAVGASRPLDFEPVLAEAERQGDLLWRVDEAAWRASDALQESDGLSWVGEGREGRGWVTTPLDDQGSRWRVSFLAGTAGGPSTSFADVEVRLGRRVRTEVKRNEPSRVLSEEEAMQHRAIGTAIAQRPPMCSPRLNTAVLPKRENGVLAGFTVYLLSASDNEGINAGGHTRISVDASGTQVLERFDQTRSCIRLAAPGRSGAVAATLSHLTSPTPTEIHVFLHRSFQLPLYVATMENRHLWSVDDGKIRLVEAPKDDATER